MGQNQGHQGIKGAVYGPGEILFLLSLTHADALDLDAYPSVPSYSADGQPLGGNQEDGPPLPVVVRWHDVHQARAQFITERERLHVIDSRLRGNTEQETAKLTGLSQPTVNRRMTAVLAQLQHVLNLDSTDDALDAADHIDLCLICGGGPRVRLDAVKRRIKGGWKTTVDARRSSVCGGCLKGVDKLGNDLRQRAGLPALNVQAGLRVSATPARRPALPARMNNPRPPAPGTGESLFPRLRWRKFPHLTREDIAILTQLPPVQARQFERFLEKQERSERRWQEHAITETALTSGLQHGGDGSPLETLQGLRVARWETGTGGGRRRQRYPSPDDQLDNAA
jgi:hypothetical protein